MSSPNGSCPRVALIGVSGYGGIYLQLLRDALQRNALKLVAAVIINPQDVPHIVAELQASGTVIYADTETFFARESGRIDLCLIPVGIQWHARLTIAALHAGMNVLVEKPLAGSLADTAAMRRAETETKRWVAVGFQDIYSLEARWLKTLLTSGVIGKLESVRMIGLWPRNRAYFSRNHWAGRIEADGAAVLDSPLNNAFAHFVNLSLYFAGSHADTSASVTVQSAELYRAHQVETFDTAVVRGRTSDDIGFWFGVSHATATMREPEIYLTGSQGRAEWWHEQRCLVIDGNGHRQVFPLPSTDSSRLLMLDSVLARLADPSVFICTTAIAENHTRLIEAVHQSGHVREFPGTGTTWIADPDSPSELPEVQDLAGGMNRALVQGCSLAEAMPSIETLVSRP